MPKRIVRMIVNNSTHWSFHRFTARASAATLLHVGYKRFSPKLQEEVFGLYMRLCKDETPLVRRMAASTIDKWALLLVDSPQKQKELMNSFKALISDDQVCRRCSAV